MPPASHRLLALLRTRVLPPQPPSTRPLPLRRPVAHSRQPARFSSSAAPESKTPAPDPSPAAAPRARAAPDAATANPHASVAPKEAPAAASTSRKARGPVSWKTLSVLAVTGGGLVAYFSYYHQLRLAHIRESTSPAPVSAGTPSLGGDFTLVECTSGREMRSADLRGKFALLYFGFTFCPDVCPDEMEKIGSVMEKLGARGAFIVPVFISIDPERDTPEKVREYLTDFHPSFVGLTGSLEQVTAAAKAYRVYFSKDNNAGRDYLVDHSIITYLIDPEGRFVEFFGKNVEAEPMAQKIRGRIDGWGFKV